MLVKPSVGIMQGRLTPSKGRGIQFFPFDEWEDEFNKAAKLGLNEIDFIFDLERYQENPLWSQVGISRIQNLVSETGVEVKSICADFFMRLPPHCWPWQKRTNYLRAFLTRLIQSVDLIGARIIEIPLLDNSSLNTANKVTNFIGFLNPCLSVAGDSGITLAIETDLPPKDLLSLILVFQGAVKVVYDTGNSASLGYDAVEEITMLGQHIVNVHIKDRILGGGTVPLGTGAVDFDAVFRSLANVDYQGSFTLQAARGEDGKEIRTISRQLSFLNKYLEKYYFI